MFNVCLERFAHQRVLLLFFLYMPFSYAMEEWEASKNEFFAAAREGNIQKIKDFELFLNARDLGGNTALIIAVNNKRTEMAKKLIELGIDIDRKNSNGQTALTLAIEAKNLEMVKLLLGAGADISEKYVGNKTPLMLAIETNDLKIIEEILNEVPDLAVVNEAITFTQTDEIRKLLGAENADKILDLLAKAINQYELYEKIKEKKSNSDISDIKTFIATNPIISLNVKSIERNPLIAAIVNANNLELVNFLIGEGADVKQIWQGGKTPLALAILGIDKPNIKIITSLLEKGADPNIEFSLKGDSFTPLMAEIMAIVAGQGTSGLLKLLVKYGAKLDEEISVEGENIPFLIFAALGNNAELVRELLEAGADPSLKNSEGQTARDIVIIELGNVTKKLEKAISKNKKKDIASYTKEKQNYENIIKLLEAKEKEIAEQKIPTTVADQKTLLTSLQDLTQKLNALQKTLMK